MPRAQLAAPCFPAIITRLRFPLALARKARSGVGETAPGASRHAICRQPLLPLRIVDAELADGAASSSRTVARVPPSLAFRRAPPCLISPLWYRGIIRCKFGGCGVRERETIIHNTGDEPILVEQADGSQMIVRPGEKRQARLLSRGDFANPAIPIYPDARRDPHPRCSDCGEVMQMLRTVQEERRPDAVVLVYRCPNGHTHEMLGRRARAMKPARKRRIPRHSRCTIRTGEAEGREGAQEATSASPDRRRQAAHRPGHGPSSSCGRPGPRASRAGR